MVQCSLEPTLSPSPLKGSKMCHPKACHSDLQTFFLFFSYRHSRSIRSRRGCVIFPGPLKSRAQLSQGKGALLVPGKGEHFYLSGQGANPKTDTHSNKSRKVTILVYQFPLNLSPSPLTYYLSSKPFCLCLVSFLPLFTCRGNGAYASRPTCFISSSLLLCKGFQARNKY